MNYIQVEQREQIKIESVKSYVGEDNEVKVIDLIDIESLGFKVPNNEITGRPTFNPKDLLKLYIYG